MLRIQTFHIFSFQSKTKKKVSSRRQDTEQDFCFSCSSQTLLYCSQTSVICKSTVFDSSSSFHFGWWSLMRLYIECYMWWKLDKMSTTAWTGFHLIWALVAFRNVSALMYPVGMFVSMCLSIHAILIITNWRQQTQKAIDEADAHVPDYSVRRCGYLRHSY